MSLSMSNVCVCPCFPMKRDTIIYAFYSLTKSIGTACDIMPVKLPFPHS